ncbi:hypothetical protein D9M73_298180 [compost metagenome]
MRLAGLLAQCLECFRRIRVTDRPLDCIQHTRRLLDACLRRVGTGIGTGRILGRPCGRHRQADNHQSDGEQYRAQRLGEAGFLQGNAPDRTDHRACRGL